MLAPAPTGDEKQGMATSEAPACQPKGAQPTDAVESARRPSRAATVLSAALRSPHFWAVTVLLVILATGLAIARPRLRGWYHLRAARSDLERFHNPQAIRHLQICLRVWPEDAEVLLLAARAARRARAYEEAERLLDKYQQVRGCDDAFSFEELLLSAERRVDQVAEACWHYVEQGHPDSPLILEALTRGYLRQYRLGQARLCLDHWLKDQPDNAQAYCLEGLFHLDYVHGRNPAEQSYRRALELDPDHEEARLGLAVALLDSKKYAEAAEHLEYVRQRQPENLSMQVGLAECRDGLGQSAEAVRLVDEVLAQQPGFAAALSLRGRLALESGQAVEAEAWLRRALAVNPSDHNANYNLIQCLYHNGNAAEAQRHELKLKRMEENLKRFDEIVTRDLVRTPTDPALHYTLGKLLLDGGQQQEGLRWLRSALRLDPQYAPARQALAEYYQRVPPGTQNRD
jgi:tetratricopeptide (TPR) repeat protein